MSKVANKIETKETRHASTRRTGIRDRLRSAAAAETEELLEKLKTTTQGLSKARVEGSRSEYGDNSVSYGRKETPAQHLARTFINPFTAILFVLAIISAFTDIIFSGPDKSANPMTVIIISTMVIISGVLRFVQETRSGRAAENLLKMIKITTNVERQGTGKQEIPLSEVVVGDIVHLSAGDMIPADMRIISAKDLFVSQSALTGESEPVEKFPNVDRGEHGSLTETGNLAFMGTNVVSGSAAGVVVVTGDGTVFGEMARASAVKPVKTSFEKGVNSVSWVLIRFMLCMVPVVMLIQGFTKGDWLQAALFGLAIAVGLTPEMLPMIVTACLAKGAVAMSKEKTIIKNLNSIQNLGSINVLCIDKTGTLTQDRVVLQYHYNIHGEEDDRILRYSFLNSYFQTGLKNLIDKAIIESTNELKDTVLELRELAYRYTKIDEIPFDFERRRMSVVVKNSKTQIVTKGAVEEMLAVCGSAEYEGKVVALTDYVRDYIRKKVDDLNEDGMRVIAVAVKDVTPTDGTSTDGTSTDGTSTDGTSTDALSEGNAFSVADEKDMTLIGYLAFLDPPKVSTAGAIKALREHGVEVKILTGDNDKVTRCVCKQVGLPVDRILLGSEVDALNDETLQKSVEEITVFARLSPQQKVRVITALRNNGHSVGFMGDGINDAAGMKTADVGISVDTAVDIAKESADAILLEKDLMVLEKGIVEGRKTYGNMIKYIKMTASSNFGNMFSVLAASAFLPFLPMLPIQIIFLNLIYDICCTSIPWDNMDREFLYKPRKWDASSIGKFMLWIGPTSSVFDITTYLLMYFYICPAVIGAPFSRLTDPAQIAMFIGLFQAGWFVESMWSQTLVIHMIRTPKIPFIQSHASFPLASITFIGIVVLTILPFTPFGHSALGFFALPPVYFGWLALTVFLYMALAQALKVVFIRRYGELL